MQSEQGFKKEQEDEGAPIPDLPGSTGKKNKNGWMGGASLLLLAVCRSFVFDSSRVQLGGSREMDQSRRELSGR